MTTEEKVKDYAKAYDKALKDMRVIYPNLKGDAKLAIEHAFPKLAESEDERIRKALIQYLKDYPVNLPNGLYSRYDFFTYLEKQKEQPTNEEMLKTDGQGRVKDDVYDSLTNEQLGVDLENTAHLIAVETLNDTKFMTTTMGYVLSKLQDIFITGAKWGAEHLKK